MNDETKERKSKWSGLPDQILVGKNSSKSEHKL